MKHLVLILRWLTIIVAGHALNSPSATLNVFAAASLTDSLKAIAASYERQTGDKVVFNFGASSFLARQIEAGAPADIFFSADEARMDGLEKEGLIVAGHEVRHFRDVDQSCGGLQRQDLWDRCLRTGEDYVNRPSRNQADPMF
jgi:molybdate transport system substrate-binding protein